MIILTSPDLPTVASPPGSGAVLTTITPNNNGASVPVSLTTGAPLEAIASTTIPSYTGDTITVTVPDGVSAVSAVDIGGEVYDRTDFWFNPLTSELTLTLKDGHIPPVGAGLRYVYQAASYPPQTAPTNRKSINLPALLVRWNVNQIEFGRSFESQPSGSFGFIAAASDEGVVRAAFANGTKIDIEDVGYSVESIQFDRLSRITYPRGAIAVTVGLTGKHVKELEAEITLIEPRSQSSSDSNNPSGSDSSLAEQQARCQAGRSSVSSLSDRAGTNYQGESFDVPTEPDEPETSTTTLDDVLKANARAIGGFVFYSDPGGPQIRSFGSGRIHNLSDAEIVELSIQLGGNGSKYKDPSNPSPYDDDDGPQLADELDNTDIELDKDPAESQRKAAQNILETKVKGNPAAEIAPSGISLRESSAAFDMGGYTQTKTIETTFNGEVLAIESFTYGFAFSSIDVYEIRNFQPVYKGDSDPLFAPAGLWRLVEHTVLIRDFSGPNDYLIQAPNRGFRLARFKQENKLEAVILQAALSRDLQTGVEPGELARRREEIKLYTEFFQLPVNANTIYTLVDHATYYPDITQDEDNPDWVPPKFAAKIETIDQTKIIRDDPTSTNDEPKPPISTGRNFFQNVYTEINYPNPGTREEVFDSSLAAFSRKTITSNSEGPLLRNSLTIEEREDFSDRPDIQPRLKRVSPDPCTPNYRPPSSAAKKYIVSTPGVSGAKKNTARRTPQKFSGAFNPDKARLAIETDLAIANSRNVEQAQITVRPTRRYFEGDLVIVQGTIYVVFSVSESYDIQGVINQSGFAEAIVTSNGFRLQCGRLIRVPVTITPVY